ncbi:MAG: PQQ-dependent sugar dehydrogenase [Pirellulaceae bacterium]|nr:PQQ-dependent sugar dehydrogenase [Pirellulaceae bacterium]
MHLRWFTQAPRHAAQRRSPARTYRPLVERLEARELLATLPPGFVETKLTGGYPVAMDFAPDGHLFVANKTGSVKLIDPDGTVLPNPFYTVAVDGFRDRGLTAIVVDPDYETNGYVYIYYTAAVPSNPDAANNGAVTKLVRLTSSAANHEVADPNSALVILDDIPSPTGIHTGGFLQFGPDGLLYIGIGEGDVAPNSQDLTNLYGKVLRIDVRGATAQTPYTIPPTNPFVGQAGKRPEIFAYGLRNPFSGGIDSETGLIYVNDVGNSTWEEVNQVVPGANYGWPQTEGPTTAAGITSPIYYYNHDGAGAAVVGGDFYHGDAFPDTYQGQYFFADLVQGHISVLDPVTHTASVFATDVPFATDLDFGPDGNLYYTSVAQNNAAVYRISYVAEGNRTPTAVSSADVTNGLAGLAVNFTAAGSSDPDDDLLTYSWDFGDGTTASGLTAQHTYAAKGVYSAVLTVSDGELADTAAPITITVGNRAPVPVINLPLTTTTYQAGQTISFAGSATDPDDGALTATHLTWSFLFGHNTHFHDFIPPLVGQASGTVTLDRVGETAADQYYRIFLTATDSGGLSTTVYRDIRPELANFTLASNIPGALLYVDGQPGGTPYVTTGVVGMYRTISAPLEQIIGGQLYAFTGWSDGGAAVHEITTPTADTTYTATYAAIPTGAAYSFSTKSNVLPNKPLSLSVTVTNVGTETWLAGGAAPVNLGVYFGGASDAIGDWAGTPTRFLLPNDLAPGESATIPVTIITPSTLGNFTLRARMVQGAAGWFDQIGKQAVNVGTLGASYTADIPGLWRPGEVRTFSVTVTNTGTLHWNAIAPDAVNLGLYFDAISDLPGDWPVEPIRFSIPNDVAPGRSVTITAFLTAPLTPGDHVLRFRMVKENVAWFDEVESRTVAVGTLHAAYASSAPPVWLPTERKTFTVTGRNTGTIPWSASGVNPVNLGVYWDAPSDAFGAWLSEPTRFELTGGDVAPGEFATFTVSMTAPTTPGDHVLRFRLVKENISWLAEVLPQTITIGTLAAEYAASIPNLWSSGETKTLSVTLHNTGTAPWPAGGDVPVSLAAYFDAASDAVGDWPSEPARFALPSDVAPGASLTIPVTLTAPISPDGHVLRLRMAKGNTYFDQLLAETITVGTLAASYATTAPASWGLGATKVFTTTVTNTGTTTWKATGPDKTQLAAYFNGTSDAVGAWPVDPPRFKLAGDVLPGQSQTLTITITAPTTAGSYVLRQRMVTEGVSFFADLAKTTVSVAKGTLAATYSSTPTTSWIIKDKKTYSITLTNKGTQTWNASGTNPVNLGIYFGDSSDAVNAWSKQPKRYALPRNVAPGQSVTMTITVQAPPTAGNFVLRARLVKENVAWFDYFQKTNVVVNTINAAYFGTIPTTWARNQQRTYSLTVTNTGVTTWNTTGTNPVMLGVYFGGASDAAGAWSSEPKRITWPSGVSSVAPGQSVTFSVTIRAPSSAGAYVLRHRLVKENVTWIDDLLKTNVTVS